MGRISGRLAAGSSDAPCRRQERVRLASPRFASPFAAALERVLRFAPETVRACISLRLASRRTRPERAPRFASLHGGVRSACASGACVLRVAALRGEKRKRRVRRHTPRPHHRRARHGSGRDGRRPAPPGRPLRGGVLPLLLARPAAADLALLARGVPLLATGGGRPRGGPRRPWRRSSRDAGDRSVRRAGRETHDWSVGTRERRGAAHGKPRLSRSPLCSPRRGASRG